MLSVIDIDREHDVAYILLRPELRGQEGAVARSTRVAEDIVLDLDEKGQLIGIELLNASARLDLDKISEGTADLIVGVKEAAEMLGVEKSNFVRDHTNKPQFPAPIAELASGRFWLRSDVLRYMKQLRVNLDVSEPRFKVGEVVALRSDPTILLPIIEVISSGSERRYKVFQNNTKQVFYESQLQTSAVAAGDHEALTVEQLHAHLTSLHILAPSTANLFSLRSGRVHFVLTSTGLS